MKSKGTTNKNVFDVLTLFNVKITVKTKYQMSIDICPSSYAALHFGLATQGKLTDISCVLYFHCGHFIVNLQYSNKIKLTF
jgi:hypothetical protein